VRTYFDKPMAWADRELREDRCQRQTTWRPALPEHEVLPFPYSDIRAFTTAFVGCMCCRDA
jgi:hypothetical protein